ncbi:hypothetical protein L9F63_018108, partial [Diploptera punctata]
FVPQFKADTRGNDLWKNEKDTFVSSNENSTNFLSNNIPVAADLSLSDNAENYLQNFNKAPGGPGLSRPVVGSLYFTFTLIKSR